MNLAWREKETDPGLAARLARELSLHPITARCLVNRGLGEPALAAAFLNPKLAALRPPEGMAGFVEAVDRLARALQSGERIGVFGDYDVDGVTSAAVLTTFIREAGGDVVPRVASRDNGYGFTLKDSSALAEAGCRLVITADTGTSDVPSILHLTQQGIDAVVVDHHQVPESGEHPAILLNPHRPDSQYPFRGFASVGLCFYLAAAVRTRLSQAGWFAANGRTEPDVRALLDLVAVGTIGDMAPLTHENRILVRLGLNALGQRRRHGLAALLDYAGVEKNKALGEVDVSWKLGPRLNAPGRLGDSAPALALLLAVDPSDAMAWAAECEQANERRRTLQDQIYTEALLEAEACGDDAVLTVGRSGWHPGVTGIVAARLMERFGKPAAVVAFDEAGEGRGSMRARSGLHVYDALASCRDSLVRFGGHEGAGGFTVRAERLAELRSRLCKAADGTPTRPNLDGLVDALCPVGRVDERLALELSTLAPFGPGNPEPVMAASARVANARRVGQEGAHLKLTLECNLTGKPVSAIAFRMGDREPGLGSSVHVTFRPEVSTYRGQSRVEVRVMDMRPA